MLKNLPLIFGAEIRLEFAPLTELQNETFCHFQTKHCVWMMCICFFKNSFGNVKWECPIVDKRLNCATQNHRREFNFMGVFPWSVSSEKKKKTHTLPPDASSV